MAGSRRARREAEEFYVRRRRAQARRVLAAVSLAALGLTAARSPGVAAATSGSGIIRSNVVVAGDVVDEILTSSTYTSTPSSPAGGSAGTIFGAAAYRAGEMFSRNGAIYVIGMDGIARQVNASVGSGGLR